MKMLLTLLIILFSSQLSAKKILLDCVNNSTYFPNKKEWDHSTNGEQVKATINSSKKNIKYGSMIFNTDFIQDSDFTVAKTDVMNDMWWHIGIENNGKGAQTWFLNETVLMVTTFECKASKSLW